MSQARRKDGEGDVNEDDMILTSGIVIAPHPVRSALSHV